MKILSYDELGGAKGIRYSREHLSRLMKLGRFPLRVQLGHGPRCRIGWHEAEIDRWLEGKLAARPTAAGTPTIGTSSSAGKPAKASEAARRAPLKTKGRRRGAAARGAQRSARA
jgi:predicted DNA-binding transcriptional regulator AlpA